ncbi:MAG: hypothetical protein KatS3mg035_0837 [Bacteroidia bacterium]|nr:MAG: hypothetical protein KatS3mg035_0837 [Bacteroidia bacterium]
MDKIRIPKSVNVRIFKKIIKIFFIIGYFLPLPILAQWEDSISLKNLDYSIQTSVLSNDLKVLYLQNPNSPLATIEWSLFPGTIVQKSEWEGMLALLDKFFLRPSQKDNSPIQFQNRISNIGLSNESEILTESIHFQWIVPNKYLKEALILLRDCWFYPKWIDLEFQREKILLAKQIQQSELTPSWFLYREMMLKVLGSQDVSRQTIAADYFNIQKIELQQLKDFKNQYFSPQNTILSISSSLDFSTILHWSDSLFADWKNPYTFSKDSLKFHLKHNASAFKITSEKTQIPIVAVSFPFQDSLTLKNFIIGNLIAQIFNSHYSQMGKFFYSKDLGYQLLCNYRPSILFSEFLFSIAMKREKLDYAIDFIRHFPVYAYHANWLNTRDLEMAKMLLKTDYFIQHQNPWQILHKITQSYFLFNNLDYIHYLDTLESITLEDLQSFFQKSINIPNPVVGFLMNSEDVNGSEIEKKLENFWLQPFGPVYDLLDPEHKIIPIPEIKTTTDTLLAKVDSLKQVPSDTTVNITLNTQFKEVQNLEPNMKNKEAVFENIVTEKNRIYFEFGSYTIDKNSRLILQKFAKYLQANPFIKLKLTGHTDSSGPEDFNLKLSLQRANKIKEFLVTQYKIAPERIKTQGLGETQLAFPEDTPQNRAKNRRVEVEVFVD